MKILMITSEWPDSAHPIASPFIVRQVDFLRLAGLQVRVHSFRGSGNPSRYIQAWWRVRSILKEDHFDLVHAQFGQSGLLALIPKSLPLVVTFRGSDVEGIVGADRRYTFSGRLLQWMSRLVAGLADQAIVVSESLIAKLPSREYHVIPSGIDLSLFRPIPRLDARRHLGLDPEHTLVLFSGSKSDPRKRYGLAEDVVQRARIRFPNIRLLSLDSVPHSEVPFYMNACDALLSTSMHEGSPNMIKEALACNLPIASTDTGDVASRIGSIPGCELCSGDRVETLSAALVRVLEWRGPVDGRTSVLGLDERLLTGRLIEVYRQALHSPRATF